MGRSQETFRKKEQNKKREQKKKEKEQKKEHRLTNSNKGKSFEDMLAYVDENGNITTQKPLEARKSNVKLEEIMISTPKMVEGDDLVQGKVKFYNDERGFGFINTNHGERIFFLISDAPREIKLDDAVAFKTQKSPKGLQAFEIEIVKETAKEAVKEKETEAKPND